MRLYTPQRRKKELKLNLKVVINKIQLVCFVFLNTELATGTVYLRANIFLLNNRLCKGT
jgi:hypothetical protein